MQTPQYKCPDCEDQGWIVDKKDNVATPCDCLKRRRVERVLKHSHIGDEFKTKTFDTFRLEGADRRIQRAYQVAKGYTEHFESVRKSQKNSLGIVGAVGVGKTHLLCAVANHLLNKGIQVRYFNFVTGFKEMLAQYDRGGQAVEEIRWELQTCDVLMLDDLAKGKFDRKLGSVDIKKTIFEETYGIVDFRYFNGLPIIWSSELYAQLAEESVLGDATATRLFERSHMIDLTYTANEEIGTLNYRLQNLGGEADG